MLARDKDSGKVLNIVNNQQNKALVDLDGLYGIGTVLFFYFSSNFTTIIRIYLINLLYDR